MPEKTQPSFDEVVRLQELLKRYAPSTDPEQAWMKIQLVAALRLIRHFLGEEWYGLIFQRINEPAFVLGRRFQQFLESKKSHPRPSQEAPWSGSPEELVRIVRLGETLKVLGFEAADTHMSVRCDELGGSPFVKAYFEFKVALTYAHNGFSVRFLQHETGKKSPDLAIRQGGVETVVKCQERGTPGVDGILERLREAQEHIAAGGRRGIAYLELEDNLGFGSPELVTYTETVIKVLRQFPAISYVILTWEKIFKQQESVQLVTDARWIPNPAVPSSFPRESWDNPTELQPLSPPLIVHIGQIPTIIKMERK